MRNLLMKKFGTPTGTGPRGASERVGLLQRREAVGVTQAGLRRALALGQLRAEKTTGGVEDGLAHGGLGLLLRARLDDVKQWVLRLGGGRRGSGRAAPCAGAVGLIVSSGPPACTTDDLVVSTMLRRGSFRPGIVTLSSGVSAGMSSVIVRLMLPRSVSSNVRGTAAAGDAKVPRPTPMPPVMAKAMRSLRLWCMCPCISPLEVSRIREPDARARQTIGKSASNAKPAISGSPARRSHYTGRGGQRQGVVLGLRAAAPRPSAAYAYARPRGKSTAVACVARPTRRKFPPMSDDDEAEGLRERLTKQGEDTLGKLAEDLMANPLVAGAIQRAFDAREKASSAQEAALGALMLPSAADIERLTRRVRSVSQRLEGIEDGIDRLDERVPRRDRGGRRRAPGGDRGPPRRADEGAAALHEAIPDAAKAGLAAPGAPEGLRLAPTPEAGSAAWPPPASAPRRRGRAARPRAAAPRRRSAAARRRREDVAHRQHAADGSRAARPTRRSVAASISTPARPRRAHAAARPGPRS